MKKNLTQGLNIIHSTIEKETESHVIGAIFSGSQLQLDTFQIPYKISPRKNIDVGLWMQKNYEFIPANSWNACKSRYKNLINYIAPRVRRNSWYRLKALKIKNWKGFNR